MSDDPTTICPSCGFEHDTPELLDLRAKVAELEGRQPRPEPITDESFPEDEQVLLGHYDERENVWLWVSSGHFDSEAEKWFCDWSDDYFPPVGHQGITHWMPLPSPPPKDSALPDHLKDPKAVLRRGQGLLDTEFKDSTTGEPQ